MWWRLGGTFGLVVGSLGAGWWCQRAGWLNEARASRLVRFIVTGPAPVVGCLSLWRMELRRPEPWLLPFLGVLISASTLLPGWWYARRARLTPPQTGSFLTCAFFSNLGYFGAFTAFALFGEAGYALCVLYLLFFTPCFYSLGFGLAAHYGTGHAKPSALNRAFNSYLGLIPLCGVAAGVALSLAGVPRPAPLNPLNHVLIPVDTALYLLAIGSQLTLASPRRFLRPCLAMSAVKFLYTPLVAWGLLALAHVGDLPRRIVLIQAATPVAVSPLIFPLLFGLDRELSNALWLFTTLLAIAWFLLWIPVIAA